MDRHVQVNLMENNDHQSIDVIQNQDTDQMTETNNTFQTKPGKDKIQGTTLSFYLILISVFYQKIIIGLRVDDNCFIHRY